MVKCHQNVNVEEMNTECSTGKNDGLWVLQELFKAYITQNIIIAALRIANQFQFYSVSFVG